MQARSPFPTSTTLVTLPTGSEIAVLLPQPGEHLRRGREGLRRDDYPVDPLLEDRERHLHLGLRPHVGVDPLAACDGSPRSGSRAGLSSSSRAGRPRRRAPPSKPPPPSPCPSPRDLDPRRRVRSPVESETRISVIPSRVGIFVAGRPSRSPSISPPPCLLQELLERARLPLRR